MEEIDKIEGYQKFIDEFAEAMNASLNPGDELKFGFACFIYTVDTEVDSQTVTLISNDEHENFYPILKMYVTRVATAMKRKVIKVVQ